ncbi:hypothetical protein MUK42_04387 [Musa troglodytarum]|uniref:Uncharacterized protein n=1 Tax=Musa troglodytarum TaxID=320322 RepID=A0A9E7KQQ5_9LILI|nr:hypothetical protein MUK42_04387 [Musa troglodytarum]URE24322.1 hypothetical protein MUK42_04387 [Musa troglodytarum]URE24323.1 hypothetical protein MUK42_04387 [Musa troglodytarum]
MATARTAFDRVHISRDNQRQEHQTKADNGVVDLCRAEVTGELQPQTTVGLENDNIDPCPTV